MKKLFYCAAALLMVLLAGSCHKENLNPSKEDDSVTFTVSAPGQIETKAIADGLNVDELHYALYQTADDYVIADTDTPLATGNVSMENKNVILDNGETETINTATLDLDLVKDQNFVIIFWAQVSGKNHYVLGDQGDLRKIKVNTATVGGNDESRAAFYANYKFDTYANKSHDVTLVRPFAQLNLGTTAESLSPVLAGQTSTYTIAVEKSEVTVLGLADVFNTVTEKPEGEVNFTFTLADTPYVQDNDEVLTVQDKSFHYVSMNYLFVSGGDDLVELSYKIQTDKGDIENTIINVPVKQNYRTNIIGNLLTTKTSFEIVVDEEFNKEDIDLKYEADGIVQVNPDLDADPKSYTRMYEISTENGFLYGMKEIVENLESGESVEFYLLQTIDMATEEYVSARVPAGASVLLATGAAPITRSSDPIVIKGLVVPIFSEVESGASVTFSGIVVEDFGGEGAAFVEQNNGTVLVSNSEAKSETSEDVELIGSGSEAVDVEEGTLSTLEELQAALRTDAAEITLANPIVIKAGETLVLDLNGKTVTATDNTSKNYSLIDNRGTLVVKNGTMKVSAEINSGWNRYSAVIANNPGGHLTVENAEIEHLGGTDMAYGIDNLTNGKGTYAVTVVDGSTVKSTYRAVRQFLNGVEATNELYVKSGSVLAGENKGIFFHDPSKNANSGKLVVEEGASVGSVYLFVTEGSTEWPVEVSIAASAVAEGGVTYKNVPEGYEVVEQDGVYKVVCNYTFDGVKTYNVYTAAGLASMNTMFEEKTAVRDAVLNLAADIDFSGYTWTPVDSHADTKFEIAEINGNGHTLSNLTINGQAMFKRFAGSGDVVVRDITFDNANVKSDAINTSILTVQSYQNVLLDNVDVKNSSITGAYKVATLIGTVYNESSSTVTATLKNCDVENVTVTATSYDFCTAGMVAFVYADDNDKIEFENCTVKDVKLIAPDDSYKAHAAIYTTGSGSLYNEAEGVTVSNVTFEALQ